MVYLNYVVFDMFRPTKFPSSGRLVPAIIKLKVQVFLRMNTWFFETCRRQCNWIKSLTKFVGSYYALCHNVRFKKRKGEKLLNPYHTIFCTLFIRVRYILGFAAQYFKHCTVFLKHSEARCLSTLDFDCTCWFIKWCLIVWYPTNLVTTVETPNWTQIKFKKTENSH